MAEDEKRKRASERKRWAQDESRRTFLNWMLVGVFGLGSYAATEIIRDSLGQTGRDGTIVAEQCDAAYELFVDLQSGLLELDVPRDEWPVIYDDIRRTVERCLLEAREDADND